MPTSLVPWYYFSCSWQVAYGLDEEESSKYLMIADAHGGVDMTDKIFQK